MSQYVHLISSMPFAMPTDLWVPVTSKIKPMQAHQVSLGGYYTGIDGWEFSIEGYYKGMKMYSSTKTVSAFSVLLPDGRTKWRWDTAALWV